MSEDDWKSNAAKLLKQYELMLVDAVNHHGYDGNDDPDQQPQWSYYGALLYSITLLTTIG